MLSSNEIFEGSVEENIALGRAGVGTAEIVQALEMAYEARETVHEPSVEFARQYDADTVFANFWEPVMAVLP